MKLDRLVSVIIPVYNVELYLKECVDSIINQSYKNLEIILVDDGSTDLSSDICDEYAQKDDRVKVIHKANGGLSSARNSGVRASKGDYIYFIDSDDFLHINAIELLVNLAEKESADLVFFDGKSFFENDIDAQNYANLNYQRTHDYGSKRGADMGYLLISDNAFFLPAWLIFCNRMLALQTSFYEGIIHEDNLYTMEMFLKAKKAIHLNEQLYYRRVRSQSIMTSVFSVKNYHGYFTCVKELMKRFDCAESGTPEYLLLRDYLSSHAAVLIDKYNEFSKDNKITVQSEKDELIQMLKNNHYLHSKKIKFKIKHRKLMKIYYKIIG